MKAWEEFLNFQEKELGSTTVNKWLRSLKVSRYDACNIYLEARDSFQILWFEEHIRPHVQTKLLNRSNKRIKIHLSLAKTDSDLPPSQVLPPPDPIIEQPVLTPFQLEWDSIDREASFNRYIGSEKNQVCYKLLSELIGYDPLSRRFIPPSLSPGAFNPIYIHGESGSGKTHLLMSVANSFSERGLRVIYAKAETFTEHVVRAIRAGEMQTFRKAYRHIDTLLIDNIEIFSRKAATQEEFFHTFNTLHVEGKQIILTANCPPQELKFIEPRLVSRFEWGIVLPLDPLPPHLLRQMLLDKLDKIHLHLSENAIEFLLSTFKSGPKALYQAVEALLLRIHLSKSEGRMIQSPLSGDWVKGALIDLVQVEERHTLTPTKIIQLVSEHYGIRPEDILGKAQSRDCSLPRQIAMYLCRQQLKLPYMKIGDLFSRDHSTVMSSVKQIQHSFDQNDPHLCSELSILTKLLKQS